MKTITQIAVINFLFLFIACDFNPSAKKDFTAGAVLADVDFSKGKYVLYIKHKELGEFMVLDEEALKENQDQLNVNVSFVNYLPGEGDRSFGVLLFKDKKLVTQKLGGVFKRFEIGNLLDYAVPVKQRRMSSTKKKIQEKLDSITEEDNIFITHQSRFVPDDRTFRFRIYFPSIAVPVTREKDSSGYERITTVNRVGYNKWTMEGEFDFEKRWGAKIKRCIRDKAGTITDFKVSIAKGSVSDAYLFDHHGEDLKTPNKKMLYIKDYMYYNFSAYVMASKDNAEKLLQLDYSDCMRGDERNRPQLMAKVKELVKQSSQPDLSIEEGEVGLSNYKDHMYKNEGLYEQEYALTWLEAEN